MSLAEAGMRLPACGGFIVPRQSVYLSDDHGHQRLDHTGPVSLLPSQLPPPSRVHLSFLPHCCLCNLGPSSGNRPESPWGAQAPPPPALFRIRCSGRRPGRSQVTGQAGWWIQGRPWPGRIEGSRHQNIPKEGTHRVGNGCTYGVQMSVAQ